MRLLYDADGKFWSFGEGEFDIVGEVTTEFDGGFGWGTGIYVQGDEGEIGFGFEDTRGGNGRGFVGGEFDLFVSEGEGFADDQGPGLADGFGFGMVEMDGAAGAGLGKIGVVGRGFPEEAGGEFESELGLGVL